ncbi:MAG TPA: flavodoxin [Treponema sp.]|nr:flavodoxin [Treponema sp.]
MKKIAALFTVLLVCFSAFAKPKNKAVVVYFSQTGNTDSVSKFIANETGADLFKVELTHPYTTEELNWRDENSRISKELKSGTLPKNGVVKELPNLKDYDTVYIGYPIWRGTPAFGIQTWVNGKDFGKKNIIPFCTSGSSPIGDTPKQLQAISKNGNWLYGKRFSKTATQKEVSDWIKNSKF